MLLCIFCDGTIFNLKEFINNQMNLLNKKGIIVAEIPNADDPLNTIYKPKLLKIFIGPLLIPGISIKFFKKFFRLSWL